MSNTAGETRRTCHHHLRKASSDHSYVPQQPLQRKILDNAGSQSPKERQADHGRSHQVPVKSSNVTLTKTNESTRAQRIPFLNRSHLAIHRMRTVFRSQRESSTHLMPPDPSLVGYRHIPSPSWLTPLRHYTTTKGAA